MEIASKYTPQAVEEKWYNYWLENNYFRSTPDEREPYTIVIPPPNVTGVLHMGHMLNNTIQDVLIRRARMRGYNACWVPGTDHASIATEAKVVAKLKEQGISKEEIGREKFLEHAWEWTHEYGGVILDQLKKLGASCDWDRTQFTMNESLSKAVQQVFVDLYNKGLIYRGYRMVNWDPEAKTNISDEEVIYKEKNGKLYHLKYQVEGTDQYIVVATTRPETIFGDTAVCIHPEDERYQWLKDKEVIVPIVNRKIKIIQDEYVDLEFGTGCLKVTPAHDHNDYNLGTKHNLDFIDIFTDDAKLNENGLHYQGMDRFKVRKEIEKELEEKGLLEKVEIYTNNVGTSERTGVVIEPKISDQWFLKMADLAKPALDNVMNDVIKFHPPKFKNTYRNWMENITDWNISRQLWWGHQIPAYFYGEGSEDFVVAMTIEEALTLAQEKTNNPNLMQSDLKQSEDALDTWFSSWLWPISVFDGINNPKNDEINYYYPTQDLVTGPDIIFFWVARMIMAGYEYLDEKPFENVYFTGIVRDKLGRKMSKSLGNSPDPVELINEFGADATRMGMLLTAPAGNDLPFDVELCVQGRNFANKIWNAFRLIKGWEIDQNAQQSSTQATAVQWFAHRFQQALADIEHNYEQYRLSDALMTIYKLIWDDFCSWYLEAIKPNYGDPIDAKTYHSTIGFLEEVLKVLHPFMPFLTEELWQNIQPRKTDEALIIANYPTVKSFDETIIKRFANTQEAITAIRGLRSEKGMSPKEALDVFTENKTDDLIFVEVFKKLGNVQELLHEQKPEKGFAFRVGTVEFLVPVTDNIDLDAEREKLTKELTYFQEFLQSVRKKLSNEKFVQGAPEAVVNAERKKESDALEKIAQIEEQLASL
ncbi:valine--tRNA ligase [Weeksella virosa]|uniref:Valine--tRNA ligase n=1 Tax=Weeksella virosa (strain ATCC 43766 / DSM 16922 / JCM 21250 / CCUG 30538 / CDC 9751 / IAM 14551 / NBRC 16016 / NCTC 11634 / CL345/78) TaxID=865938 RepID=F0P0Q4_WEEVC|nr:valine--tRNA ligase [Weeksella virosa]ADX68553.1 Valyl-tRNA synthetase [Weeksella virosa DSM 16922]VEH63788.1 Valine--tRNA ligase [Weeksella virosa]